MADLHALGLGQPRAEDPQELRRGRCPDLRSCVAGVAVAYEVSNFAVSAHEAPPDEFPAQPSQKDGLGRMCKPHWNQYTSALRKAALARKASETAPAEPEPVEAPEPIRARARRGSNAVVPAAGSQGDAG
jgi:hypothetical protein